MLANPEIAALPAWVIAFVAAGGLAAALSTAAGLLLVISTSVSHDLYAKPSTRADRYLMSELLLARIKRNRRHIDCWLFRDQQLRFRRSSRSTRFWPRGSITISVILLGIFDQRTNREGAIAGMLVGLAFTMAYIVYFVFEHRNISTQTTGGLAFLPQGIGMVGAILNLVTAYSISRLTEDTFRRRQRSNQRH